MAAPTHWFYGGPNQVIATYGGLLNGFTKPAEHLPGSIMSKSNTGGGGRGSYQGDVIGNIIFHGKKKYWRPGADYHYHHLLEAGDNTLEGLLARRVMAVTAEKGGKFDPEAITQDYIDFLTTPDTHNDTYCGTCHRMFFANHAAGKKPKECPDNDRHNVDTIDSLVVPTIASLIAQDYEQASQDAQDMVFITRDSPTSAQYVAKFTSLFRSVVQGSSVREAVAQFDKRVPNAVENAGSRGQDPLTACYLDSAFPAMLFMAYKYAPAASQEGLSKGFLKAVCANANRGGENVGSGALLGALWGAEVGFSNLPPSLINNLAVSQRKELDAQVDAFIQSIKWLQDESCSSL